jgi:hypothetical protein
LTSQRLVRPSNFQNAPFAAVRNAWSTTRALLPSLGAVVNRAACASLTDYQSFFWDSTSSNAPAGTFASPLPPTHQPEFAVRFPRCMCFAEFPCIAFGTQTNSTQKNADSVEHLQNALFAIIAASYDLSKSMCAHSDHGHKLT